MIQLLDHNSRHTKILALEDEIRDAQTMEATVTQSQPNISVPAVTEEALKLLKLGWSERHPTQTPSPYQLSPLTFITLFSVASYLEIPGFTNAIKSFVAATKAKDQVQNGTVVDIPNIESWFVRVHSAVKCFVADVDSAEANAQKVLRARCAPDWQESEVWRNDYVWIQERSARTTSAPYTDGKVIGHISLILSILDNDILRKTGARVHYRCVFVKMLRLLNHGKPGDLHGLVECSAQDVVSPGGRVSHQHRAFGLQSVVRPAHVIPTEQSGHFYVNHHVDREQYAELRDAEFLANGIEIASSLAQ